jgi:hypothetical protein
MSNSDSGEDGYPPGHSEDSEPGTEADVFAVKVEVSPEDASRIIASGEYDFGDRPHFSAVEGRDTSRLDLFVNEAQIEALREDGLDVEVMSNQSERARLRLGEVGEGDRFEGGKVAPRGLGRKIGRGHEAGESAE